MRSGRFTEATGHCIPSGGMTPPMTPPINGGVPPPMPPRRGKPRDGACGAGYVSGETRFLPGAGSACRHAPDGEADQVREARRERPEHELPQGAAPERTVGEPGHQAAADDRGERGQAESDPKRVETE